jgi:small-conductance mechanosensitive channel
MRAYLTPSLGRASGRALLAVLTLVLAIHGLGIALAQNPVPAANPQDILQFLNQTIGWYGQLAVEQQIASEPTEWVVVTSNRRIADQVVRLSFDFARAEVESGTNQNGAKSPPNQGPASSQYQSLAQLSAQLNEQVGQLQSELDSLKHKLEASSGKRRRDIQTSIAEAESELQLTQARRDAIRNILDFAGASNASGLGAAELREQIEALARSVPAASAKPAAPEDNASANQQLNPPAASSAQKTEPTGIWGLSGELFAISHKSRTIKEILRATDALAQSSNRLRAPLEARLREFSARGDEIAKQADTADPAALAQEKQQLDQLTAQFKQISALIIPLSKQQILFDIYKRGLTNWQETIRSEYTSVLKSLLLRLVLLGLVVAIVIAFGEVWRRTIYRYVHDARRRYQFLLLRRIVLWFVVALIIAFGFASQLGQVATFAGLLTAGVAVALQNVILSIVGYFFLIGRFGIRVGDRVQVGSVTGEVIDIGLVRFHVMELGSGGGEAPTGRVVAFSNSIVFQPASGLFRQIPGTNFVWHEIILTLSAEGDYRSVEKRLLAAVESVFADYREEMERQYRQIEATLTYTTISALRPRSWLRLTQAGLEVTIRYPVTLQNASEIDDRVTRELLQAIERELKLKLVSSGTPSITLRTDVAAPGSRPS